MERISFTPGMKFRLNDQEYVIRKFVGDDDVELTNLSYDDQVVTYKLSELVLAWYENQLIMKKENISKESEILVYDTNVLTEEEKDLMEKRFQILKPIIAGEVKSANYKDYLLTLSDEQSRVIGSLATLYRMKKRWDDTGDIRSLIPHSRFKKKRYNTDEKVISIIERIIRDEEKNGLESTTRDRWILMKDRVKEYNETRDDENKIKPCGETTVFFVHSHILCRLYSRLSSLRMTVYIHTYYRQ